MISLSALTKLKIMKLACKNQSYPTVNVEVKVFLSV